MTNGLLGEPVKWQRVTLSSLGGSGKRPTALASSQVLAVYPSVLDAEIPVTTAIKAAKAATRTVRLVMSERIGLSPVQAGSPLHDAAGGTDRGR